MEAMEGRRQEMDECCTAAADAAITLQTGESTLPLLLLLMVVRTCTGLGAQGDVWYLSLEGILMFPFLTLLIFLSGTPFLLR